MNERDSINDILNGIRRGARADRLVEGNSFGRLSDESILRLYDGIRREVEADNALGGRYRLVGDAAKARARRLQDELVRRGLSFMPIRWP